MGRRHSRRTQDDYRRGSGEGRVSSRKKESLLSAAMSPIPMILVAVFIATGAQVLFGSTSMRSFADAVITSPTILFGSTATGEEGTSLLSRSPDSHVENGREDQRNLSTTRDAVAVTVGLYTSEESTNGTAQQKQKESVDDGAEGKASIPPPSQQLESEASGDEGEKSESSGHRTGAKRRAFRASRQTEDVVERNPRPADVVEGDSPPTDGGDSDSSPVAGSDSAASSSAEGSQSGTLTEEEREQVRRSYRTSYLRKKMESGESEDGGSESAAGDTEARQKAGEGVAEEGTAGAKASARLKTIHASELEKPKGARTSGKVEEFLGSHTEDGSSMVRGQNVTRLSYALYKIVRLFNLRKLVDFPSGAHVEWMPEVVTRFEYDVPGFSYVGVDRTEELVERTRAVGAAYGGAEFEVGDVEERVPAEGADMLLVWPELDGERTDPRSPEYAEFIVRVLRAAKRAKVRYITFGQFPRLRGMVPIYAKGRWRFIGKEREDPFIFNEHVRGVVPMDSGNNGYYLHLTLFSLRSFNEDDL